MSLFSAQQTPPAVNRKHRRRPGHLTICFALVLLQSCKERGVVALQNAPGVESVPNRSAHTRLSVRTNGQASKMFVQETGSSSPHPLTSKTDAWESTPVLSANGAFIAYTTAKSAESKSEVWVAHIDGSHAHRVSAKEDDALLPAFLPNNQELLYVFSRFNGHFSPIARPRRHEFDVKRVTVDADSTLARAVPLELTQQHLFDCRSLTVSSDGERFLISTSGYPIGSLLEEFDIATPMRTKRIFQPHVPGEPSGGASYDNRRT